MIQFEIQKTPSYSTFDQSNFEIYKHNEYSENQSSFHSIFFNQN